MKINEIFKSIQGETSCAGQLCSFVRFTGCNLRCSYCDTEYAYSGGEEMTVDGVIGRLSQFGCNLVMVTGGEPLLQEEVYLLVDELLSRKYRVLVETNGSLPVERLNGNATKIVDLKCPDSGMCDRMDWSNLLHLTKDDEIKFVLSSRKDYDWAKSIVDSYGLDKKLTVLLSVAWGKVELGKLAGWMVADSLNARLQPQLHKLIWKGSPSGTLR